MIAAASAGGTRVMANLLALRPMLNGRRAVLSGGHRLHASTATGRASAARSPAPQLFEGTLCPIY